MIPMTNLFTWHFNFCTNRLIKQLFRLQDNVQHEIYVILKQLAVVMKYRTFSGKDSIWCSPFQWTIRKVMFHEDSRIQVLCNCTSNDLWNRLTQLVGLARRYLVYQYKPQSILFSVSSSYQFLEGIPTDNNIMKTGKKNRAPVWAQHLQDNVFSSFITKIVTWSSRGNVHVSKILFLYAERW